MPPVVLAIIKRLLIGFFGFILLGHVTPFPTQGLLGLLWLCKKQISTRMNTDDTDLQT